MSEDRMSLEEAKSILAGSYRVVVPDSLTETMKAEEWNTAIDTVIKALGRSEEKRAFNTHRVAFSTASVYSSADRVNAIRLVEAIISAEIIDTSAFGVTPEEFAKRMETALDLLKEGQWIPVEEAMPEEKESIFSKFKNTDSWKPAMFDKMSDDVRVIMELEDGRRMVGHSYTVDGKWQTKGIYKKKVTHWMPNPRIPAFDD